MSKLRHAFQDFEGTALQTKQACATAVFEGPVRVVELEIDTTCDAVDWHGTEPSSMHKEDKLVFIVITIYTHQEGHMNAALLWPKQHKVVIVEPLWKYMAFTTTVQNVIMRAIPFTWSVRVLHHQFPATAMQMKRDYVCPIWSLFLCVAMQHSRKHLQTILNCPLPMAALQSFVNWMWTEHKDAFAHADSCQVFPLRHMVAEVAVRRRHHWKHSVMDVTGMRLRARRRLPAPLKTDLLFVQPLCVLNCEAKKSKRPKRPKRKREASSTPQDCIAHRTRKQSRVC